MLFALLIVGVAAAYWVLRPPANVETRQAALRVALFKAPASDAVEQLLPEFERLSGVKVELETLPYGELLDKTQTEFLAKSPTYDVIMADCIWIPKFARAGYLRPIDAFLRDPSLTPADYQPEDIIPSVGDYLGKFPKNGISYGFPFMTNSHVLAYRRDLYEKELAPKGIREPGRTVETAWTWDEYLAAAKILTTQDSASPTGKRWGSSMQAKAGAWIVYEWYSWLFGFGGRDIDYATMTPAFTEPGSVEAIRRYSSMVGAVAPASVTSWGHEEETQALASGEVAMDATSNVELAAYLTDASRSKFASQIAFAVSPVSPGKAPTPDMGGYGLLLSNFSKNPSAAYQFMSWVTSPSVHRRIVLAGGTPFRFSEMRDPEILARYPVYEIYDEALANSVYRMRVPNWPEIEDIISKELTRAITKEATAEEAGAAMQSQVSAVLKR